MCLHAVNCAHDNQGVSDRACLSTLYCITDQKGDVFGHFAAVMRLCVPLPKLKRFKKPAICLLQEEQIGRIYLL
jgi:hypothetical protein